MTMTKISQARLATCDELIQKLVWNVHAIIAVYVLCGNRSNAEQDEAYKKGTSKAKPGQSPHNFLPSLAVDLQPMDSSITLRELAQVVIHEAKKLGIQITWGGDWDGDGDETNEKFRDKFHYEFTDWKERAGKNPLPTQQP
jgi:peptidoglycan L-alanyl-D-glutamate endopeptidase CwlK